MFSADDATKRLHKLAREHAKTVSELTSVRLLASQAAASHDELTARVRAANEEAEASRRASAASQAETQVRVAIPLMSASYVLPSH